MPLRLSLPVLLLAQLSACGGGSSGRASSGGSNPESPSEITSGSTAGSNLILDGPVHGVIVVEERGGKRWLDGWFTRAVEPESASSLLWQDGVQYCESPEALDAAALARAFPSKGPLAGTYWRQTLFAGVSVDITSRSGVVASLRAQRLGDAVLYAMDERWLDDPLPEDSRLRVPGSDVFPAFESVVLAPLTPLVVEQPVEEMLSELAEPILWQASATSGDRIELNLSRLSGTSDQPSVHNVRCSLSDNGRFVLPAEVQAVLAAGAAQDTQSAVTLIRKREALYIDGDSSLAIVQYSYP